MSNEKAHGLHDCNWEDKNDFIAAVVGTDIASFERSTWLNE